METEEAVTEFVNMLRLGTAALREIVSKDVAIGSDLEEQINQLLYLADSIDDVGDSIRGKTQSLRRGTTNT